MGNGVWERVYLDTDRGRFEVFVNGVGKPLCVTHLYSEFNETGDRFANQFVAHRQTFLVNLKEAGKSPRVYDDSELAMEQAVEDLEAIRRALGFAVWDFAGHSTGGMLGLLYAVRYGGSLGALIVVGAAASKAYTSQADCIYHSEHPKFERMQELRALQLQEGLSPEQKSQYGKEITKLSLFVPDNYDRYFAGNVRKNVAPKRLEHFSRVDFPNFELTQSLRSVTVRSLVMCGVHDVQCPLRCSVEIHENMPNSQLVVFAASNHYPFLEEEAAFSKHVALFMQG